MHFALAMLVERQKERQACLILLQPSTLISSEVLPSLY